MLYSNHIYIILLWFGHTILILQKDCLSLEKALRLMLFLRRDAHNYPLFKDCNILKFHDRTALVNSILIHKSFKPKHKLLQRNQKEDNIIEKPRTISKKFSTIEQNLTRKKYSNKKVHSNIKIDMNIGNRR